MIDVLCLMLAFQAADWPIWGRDNSRNMVSPEKGLPEAFEPGKPKAGSEEIDPATTKGVRWTAKLGSQAYGNPTIAGGRVFVGTNNEVPRDPKFKGDRAVVMCFDEKSGEFLWQLAIPKLGTGKVSDWEYLGICSSPAVEGDRLYLTTNRCEVICMDVRGQANGNDGPFTDEAKYLADKGQPPATLGPKDGDILWRFDMIEELGVFPHNITAGSVLILGDKLVAVTSNGVDWTHTSTPNPRAPTLVVLDKGTGALLGEEASGISARTLHGNWSTPAYGDAGGRPAIFFGGGDGFCYSFAPEPVAGLLTQHWRLDCNPPHYRMKNGKPIKYATREGPSEVMATPVFFKNRIYCAIGQDPEHGEGLGRLVCIDAATGAEVWATEDIARTMSTVAIADGLLYIADFNGVVQCREIEKGASVWKHDTETHIWSSPLVADGKVYVGTEDGDALIFAAGRTKKLLSSANLRAPVYSSPVAANGTIYIASMTHLYAVGK